MDVREFCSELMASYPQGLRPDADFLSVIQKEIRKRPCSSEVFERTLEVIRGAFRMFPTLPDINWAISEAFKSVSSGPQTGFEYFDLGKHTFVRPVQILANGEVLRKDLPEGADNYQLVVPWEFQADHEPLSAEQAYREGCISEELYKAIRAPDKSAHDYKGRFEKIGEFLKEEKPIEVSPEDEYIDDSMAANPEAPIHDNYEDI